MAVVLIDAGATLTLPSSWQKPWAAVTSATGGTLTACYGVLTSSDISSGTTFSLSSSAVYSFSWTTYRGATVVTASAYGSSIASSGSFSPVTATLTGTWLVAFTQVGTTSVTGVNSIGGSVSLNNYSYNQEGSSGTSAVIGIWDSNGQVPASTLTETWSSTSTPSSLFFGGVIIITGALTPSAPTLVSPGNGAYAAMATSPQFTWSYNNSDGSTQAYYQVRYKASGGPSYSYWNAGSSAWQSTAVWNTSGTGSVTTASSVFSNGTTYNWSVATESSYGLQGSFATDSTFVCQAAPTVSITGPTGSQSTSQPTVTYSTSSAGGTSLISYRVMVYPNSIATGGGFSPGVTAGAAWDSGVVIGAPPGGGVQVAVPLANEAQFVACMEVTETGNEASAWATSSAWTEAYSLPDTPSLLATSGLDTNGVPANVLTVYETASGTGSPTIPPSMLGAFMLGTVLLGGSGLSGGSSSDTGYTVTVTYSDAYGAGTLRYGNAVALTPGTELTIYDYESTPGVTRTYTATVNALAAGVLVASEPASASSALNVSQWWLIEPLTPANSLGINVTAHSSIQHESVAAHYPISSNGVITPPTVISGGINGDDGQITVQTQSLAEWTALKASVLTGTTKWLISPYSDGVYARLSLANPISGQSGAAHQTTITPSPASVPVRNSQITYVQVSQP